MSHKKAYVFLLMALLFGACGKRSKDNFLLQEPLGATSGAIAPTMSEGPARQPPFLSRDPEVKREEFLGPQGGYQGPIALPNQPLAPPPPPPLGTDNDLAPPLGPPGPALYPFARCNDGILQGLEQCDLGAADFTNSEGCNLICSKPFCGNGVTESVVVPGETPATRYEEECDDGNNEDGDGCSSRCLFERCGNARIDPGEECDDGNITNGDGCSACCTVERCGNCILDYGEQCDDGNLKNGDGCSDCCKLELPIKIPTGCSS